MGLFGNLIGQGAGAIIGGLAGGSSGASIGQGIGGTAGGALIPFHTGGLVKKNRTRAILKAGEYVLPKSVKPTKAQKAKVAALHRKKYPNGKDRKK